MLDHLAEGWWRLPVRLRSALVALVVGMAVLGLVRRADESPWGRGRPVLVVATDTPAGDPVTTVRRDWPEDLVPATAIIDLPERVVARTDLRAGEVLTTDAVAGTLADLLKPDEVAIALAQDLPDLPTGARLVVLGTAFDGTGRRLASGRLLARSPTWTWVAVGASSAPAVAAAVATGQVTVALAGGP